MYKTGDYIIYGGEGVCRIAAVGAAPSAAVDQSKTYYTLSPMYHGGVIYTPTDVQIHMRPVLSEAEARAIIADIPKMQNDYQRYSDTKEAVQGYRSYLETYECVNLIHLIRMIYEKNRAAMSAGKGCGQTDDRFLKRAKELLYGEFAISLGIPYDQVERAIIDAVEQADAAQA